jgi:hypothetical protein
MAYTVKKELTVKKVAAMSGVSVRTLHFYDEMGLLKPEGEGVVADDLARGRGAVGAGRAGVGGMRPARRLRPRPHHSPRADEAERCGIDAGYQGQVEGGEGRGGRADNAISTMVKEKKLKRNPLHGQQGSRYMVAQGARSRRAGVSVAVDQPIDSGSGGI